MNIEEEREMWDDQLKVIIYALKGLRNNGPISVLKMISMVITTTMAMMISMILMNIIVQK